ncbi:hypothetical protein [Parasitella parasitica]|uniref:Uncharacterized protein n=1 Tax=Parasitella parasitica TaxID=35722 RepID=A0A0B7NJI1_9FUNG|nr:hypothetical protein [Parasitella parasitica]
MYYGDDEEFITATEAMREILYSNKVPSFVSSSFLPFFLSANQSTLPGTTKQFNLEIEDCAPGEEMFFRLANNTSRSTTTITLRLDNTMHEEMITLPVIDGSNFSIILGMPWLRRHNPTLQFDNMTIEMDCLHKGSNSSIPSSSIMQASSNSTSPTFISIDEPVITTVTTEETIASNITQPLDEVSPVDNSPLPHYQEFLLAPILDQWWLENYNSFVFLQENDT